MPLALLDAPDYWIPRHFVIGNFFAELRNYKEIRRRPEAPREIGLNGCPFFSPFSWPLFNLGPFSIMRGFRFVKGRDLPKRTLSPTSGA